MIGSNLVILVENRGRQTYETINDFKVSPTLKIVESYN